MGRPPIYTQALADAIAGRSPEARACARCARCQGCGGKWPPASSHRERSGTDADRGQRTWRRAVAHRLRSGGLGRDRQEGEEGAGNRGSIAAGGRCGRGRGMNLGPALVPSIAAIAGCSGLKGEGEYICVPKVEDVLPVRVGRQGRTRNPNGEGARSGLSAWGEKVVRGSWRVKKG